MKDSRKLFSLVLAGILCASAILTSCNNSGDDQTTDDTTADTTTADTTTAETEPEPLTDGLPEVNMDGFSLNIHHHDTTWLTWTKTQLDADEMTSELINDAIYERNRKIENRFNAVINVTAESTPSNGFAAFVQSGDSGRDIQFLYGVNANNINYVSDMDALTYISLDKEWWNPPASQCFRLGDKQVAAAGSFSLSYISGTSAWMMNKDMYKNLQVDYDVYDLVREGEWTQDKFFEICRAAIADTDGDGEVDRFGTGATSLKAYIGALTQGAGFNLITKDKDGYPVFDVLNNQALIDYMMDLLEIYNNEPNIYSTDGGLHDTDSKVLFENGDCLFREVYLIDIEKYRDTDIDFSILPTPKLNEEQSQYLTRSSVGEIAVLPRSADAERYDNISILLEALSFDSQQNLLPAYKEVLLKARSARDSDSSDMLDYVFTSIAFDAGRVWWEGDINNPINTVYLNHSDTLVSTITSLQTSAQRVIESYIEAAKNMP